MEKQRGFTLVEIIVVTLILSLAGLGVFGIFQVALKVLAGDKAREGALAVLNEKIELVRNLPYNEVGTVGGVIPGSLRQNATEIRNKVSYSVNTQVIYVDDPFDGIEGGNPDDTVPTDYKKVKITASWETSYGRKQLKMITYAAPKGIETTAGGGTLRITSLDASGQPMPNAEVHLVNNQINPAIDTTLQTNDNGILNIPGLTPAQESYKITVSKAGHNSDYTCAIDALGAACTDSEGNPVPTKAHASVIAGELTEISFNIDLLANLNIRTLSQAIPSIWTANTDDTAYNQDNPSFAQCANNYFIFSWRDFRQQNNPRIYAQKYSPSHVKQWSEDIAITTSNNQNNPAMVVDNNCNSYFSWQDDRNGNQDIYFDKYNSSGVQVWEGIKKVDTAADSADQTKPEVEITASSTALYLVWQDNRDDEADILIQKYDLAGNQLWIPEFKVNVETAGSQQNPIVGIDTNEYIYIGWQDNRSGDNDIYLQKINPNGLVIWSTEDKRVNFETAGEQQNPDLAINNNIKNIYIVWQDNRLGYYHIYWQKLAIDDGHRVWPNDVRVDGAPDTASAKSPKIAIDSAGTLYIVWSDNRNGTDDVYLQKFDSDGIKLLTNDVRINLTNNGQQENPDLLINNNGYPVICWQDDALGDFDIVTAEYTSSLNNPVGLGNIPVIITGAKTIGVNPIIYKYQNTFVTDGNGNLNLTNIEWDSYNITTGVSYTIQKSEPPVPIDVLPGSTQTVNLYVTPR